MWVVVPPGTSHVPMWQVTTGQYSTLSLTWRLEACGTELHVSTGCPLRVNNQTFIDLSPVSVNPVP